jgi:hydrogenase nickel incorporation protein HypA/HybF
MHEASIAAALLEQVRPFVPDHSGLKIVHVEIGDLEHLDALVLDAAWRGLTADTPFAGSSLNIERTPIRVRCRACSTEYVPEDPAIMVCPTCGAARPTVLQGSGVLINRIEIEADE